MAALLPILLAFLLAPLLASGCASTGASTAEGGAGGSAAADPGDAPDLPATGVKAGWMLLKAPSKAGQMTTLTLLSEGSREGKLIATGRAHMDGGKVISDIYAADLLLSFEKAGFDRYAVKANPQEGPAGAQQVVWIDRGNGYESLFLMPGQRLNPETKEIPDVFDNLKKLILSVHQTTPGSSVHVGQGWTGEVLLDQKPGDVSK